MTGADVLVLTTVHLPDDTRIRERLIPTLGVLGSITYATQTPGPSDSSGLIWRSLSGGRLRRNLGAVLMILRPGWDLIVLHDPETIPVGALASLLLRIPVVFDVHEDLPGQIGAKSWVPGWARPLFRALARALFWLAERTMLLTLAEPGYRRLFRDDHPVFPNHPRSVHYPDPLPEGDGSAVYLGDVTTARGIKEAVAACRDVGVPLKVLGRIEPGLSQALRRETGVSLVGYLPNPVALDRVAQASVGLSPLRDLPNYRHSLPTKTLEYLAMGVPVVATDLPGTRAVLAGLDAVWLVAPGDTAGMSRAIEQAVLPAAKQAATAQATDIRTRFRWPEDEVLSFYQGLLSRRGTPTPS